MQTKLFNFFLVSSEFVVMSFSAKIATGFGLLDESQLLVCVFVHFLFGSKSNKL